MNRAMRSVEIELKGRGIVIGLVRPGWVQTDMGGEYADITPQESASSIIKLALGWRIEQSAISTGGTEEVNPWSEQAGMLTLR